MTSTDITAGQEVCVMPCTLNPYKDTPYNPYVPQAINGVPLPFVETLPRLAPDPPFVQRPGTPPVTR